ncbi:hypothetical protein C5N14_30875 [Micromonospora sp. MW-13]|uniref:hypothetical protein n=1 Tax=Micromonospora sp. MW-13 TaxID=2094022 RepID=UPI000E438DE2|nr:hypothetical protein [Micromonospora sp. MW-13]RGC64997.1 hypothetical protein C5N14_30875 [Micromonospora sp. MW-13]
MPRLSLLLRASLIPLGLALAGQGLRDLSDEADTRRAELADLAELADARRRYLAGAGPDPDELPVDEQPAVDELPVDERPARPRVARALAVGVLGLAAGVIAGRVAVAAARRAAAAAELAAAVRSAQLVTMPPPAGSPADLAARAGLVDLDALARLLAEQPNDDGQGDAVPALA